MRQTAVMFSVFMLEDLAIPTQMKMHVRLLRGFPSSEHRGMQHVRLGELLDPRLLLTAAVVCE